MRFCAATQIAVACLLACDGGRTRAAPAALAAQRHGAQPVLSAARAPASAPPAGAPAPRDPARLDIGGSRLIVTFERGAFDIGDAALLAFIQRCARAVEAYYGTFPVKSLQIRLTASPGSGLRGGQVLPQASGPEGQQRDPTLLMRVGVRSGPAHFERNWSMTHEMVHLALPHLPRAHHWLEEGLATYVEPIARARAGWISEDSVWREWIDNLPRGLPRTGDEGLDHTASWARTYWGGALFCFLADLEIRKASAGRFELRDALRGILASGGDITRRWTIERVLSAGDAATDGRALRDLYARMKGAPVKVDLDAIWRELGVSLQAGRVRYDDLAPLAAVRRRIVRGR